MIMDVQEATTRRLPDLKGRHLPENCREAVNAILKETYGYELFRNLEIYDDLSSTYKCNFLGADNKQ